MNTKELEAHWRQLVQCESTGVKPRVYRQLLEEITTSWSAWRELYERIKDNGCHCGVCDDIRNMYEETAQSAAAT